MTLNTTPKRTLRSQWATLLLLLAMAGCRSDSGPSADKQVLIRADQEFARTVGEEGAEAWAGFFAEDGMMLPDGAPPLVGREKILQAMTPFFANSANALQWEPESAEIAASGELGFTVGRYTAVSAGADGQPVESHGSYVTIWRKQSDGRWKVVVDIGNPNSR